MKIREPATCNIQVNWVSLICQSKRQPKVFRRRMFGLPFNLTDSKILICFRISRTPFISPSLSHTFTVPLSRISHCPCVCMWFYIVSQPRFFPLLSLSVCALTTYLLAKCPGFDGRDRLHRKISHLFNRNREEISRASHTHDSIPNNTMKMSLSHIWAQFFEG